MNYRYHVQKKAAETAEKMFSTPMDYPLQEGLPDEFRERFADFRSLMKEMYNDMSRQPEAYGLKLVDIAVQSNNIAITGNNMVSMLRVTLASLFESGELMNHQLIVSNNDFKNKMNKNKAGKYELIMERLSDFGFEISDYSGNPVSKTAETFLVAYPDSREMIDTIHQYFVYCRNRPHIWDGGSEDLFLYVHAADFSNIPKSLASRNYLIDNGFSEEVIKFFDAFFEYSLLYKDVSFKVSYARHIHAKGCRYYYNSTELASAKFDWDGNLLYINLKDRKTFDSLDPAMASEYWRLLALEHGLEESNEAERESRRNQTDEYMTLAHAFYDYFQSRAYRSVHYKEWDAYFDGNGNEMVWGHSHSPKFLLTLKNILSDMGKYQQEILAMPESIISLFRPTLPKPCSGHGSKHCGGELPSFTFEDKTYPSACCYRQSIDVYGSDAALVPFYWRLLEIEYGL